MPLHDSFRKKPTKPNVVRLPSIPTLEDLTFGQAQAQRTVGEPFILSWQLGTDERFLYILKTFNGETSWVLRSGEALSAPVMWRYSTSDTQMIYTFIAQEIEISQSKAVIPEELRPKPESSAAEQQTPPASEPAAAALPPPAPTNENGDQNEILSGSLFVDRYEVISKIGRGGMGIVYKARQPLIDRLVALKVLHAHLVTDEINKKRFEQEAKAASALSHPNLIMIFDFGFSSQGRPYIVMDYIEGPTLQDVIDKEGEIDLNTFVRIFRQCCHALSHAHKRSVIHRDLKPSNIVLAQGENFNEVVKVIDFGLAKILARDNVDQSLTQTGSIVGSPYFMSPEQCRGEPLDARSDIYALGCVMYVALTDSLPFAGHDVWHTLVKHAQEQAPPFREARPDLNIPSEIERIVLKAAQLEKEKRYQSIDELLSDIEQLDLNRLEVLRSQPDAQYVSGKISALRNADTSPNENISVRDLLYGAGCITQEQSSAAEELVSKLGGEVGAMLVANGAINYPLFESAKRCKTLVGAGHMSVEHSKLLLQYCQRTQMDFENAIKDLGWRLPE